MRSLTSNSSSPAGFSAFAKEVVDPLAVARHPRRDQAHVGLFPDQEKEGPQQRRGLQTLP